jgi:hypothetical protein
MTIEPHFRRPIMFNLAAIRVNKTESRLEISLNRLCNKIGPKRARDRR